MAGPTRVRPDTPRSRASRSARLTGRVHAVAGHGIPPSVGFRLFTTTDRFPQALVVACRWLTPLACSSPGVRAPAVRYGRSAAGSGRGSDWRQRGPLQQLPPARRGGAGSRPIHRARPGSTGVVRLQELDLFRAVVTQRPGHQVGVRVRARVSDDVGVTRVVVGYRVGREDRSTVLRPTGSGTWTGRPRFADWNSRVRHDLLVSLEDAARRVTRDDSRRRSFVDRTVAGPIPGDRAVTVLGGLVDHSAPRLRVRVASSIHRPPWGWGRRAAGRRGGARSGDVRHDRHRRVASGLGCRAGGLDVLVEVEDVVRVVGVFHGGETGQLVGRVRATYAGGSFVA
jgi:hypothetical protein